MTKIWKIKTKAYNRKTQDWLLKILAQNRNLNTPQKLKNFLYPSIEQIITIKLTDVEKAIQRISRALKNKEKIIIYSDYDADGICATAIMWETLHDLGANVTPYVPHRIKEGYGLASPTISKLAAENVRLIITVDHGVTAVKQVEHARKLGLDVIITDHHVLPKKLPHSHALVHTIDLCGAGVSWRLCWEIIKKLAPSYKQKLLEKLELAALATIADLVPLLEGNRAIVKIGLQQLSQTKRPGLKALIAQSGITGQIGTYEIGHILAPRINAMGRIEHGMDSLRLICTQNPDQAQKLARLLSQTNTKRQDLTASAIGSAIDMIEENSLIGIISHEMWHEGIIGLVAARLVETFHKPMIVISRGQVYSKGSARSIPGFNIVEAIRSSAEYLVDGGGHPMAAGFTIETQKIELFSHKLNQFAQANLTEEILTLKIEIECELSKEDITQQTLQTISMFEPYGVSNPQPLFVTRNMIIEDIRTVGLDNKHLKLQVDGHAAIGFNLGHLRPQLRPGYALDLVYSLSEDKYNGRNNIQLKIKDVAIKN